MDRKTGNRDMEQKKAKITIKDIALIGVMTAVIEVSKTALSFLPNIELVTFWIILFTLFFEWRILFVIPVFILIEGSIYGFGIWWVMYLYLWPMLAGLAYLFRKQQSVWFWSILSSLFGLLFGLFCAIPYVIIGAAGNGIRAGLYAGFTWWVSGIPLDIVHGVGNFAIMLVLYKPVRSMMEKIKKGQANL